MTKSLIIHFPNDNARRVFANNLDPIWEHAKVDDRYLKENDPTNDYWDALLDAYSNREIRKEYSN